MEVRGRKEVDVARLVRRAAAALALVLAATLSPVVLSSADGVVTDRSDPWTSGYYYYDSGGSFAYVPTNAELWKSRRITNVSTGISPGPQTPELFDGKVLEAIWKKSCSATNAQTVTMSRKVQLPGNLSSLHVGLDTVVTDGSFHRGKNPFSWAEVRLNGSTLLRLNAKSTPLSTWKSVDLAAGAVEVLYGTNTLSVVAKKRTTKKSWRFCSSGTPDFGVAAEVYAVPRSELTSSIPTGSFSGQMHATITNAGPSHMVGGVSGGQFWFRTYEPTGEGYVVDALGQVGGVVDTCTTYRSSEDVIITCEMPVLAPGQTLGVDIYLQIQGSCPGDWKIPFAYKVVGLWREANVVDNGQGERSLGCLPQ